MKALYLDCAMGAAGDMLMAALYELLDDIQKEVFLQTMRTLPLPDVALTPQKVSSCGIMGTHMCVSVCGEEEAHHHDHVCHHHSTPAHIASVIESFPLPEKVKRDACAVYDAIAHAEAQVHGCDVGNVHFHEVGALDAIADVTGVCFAMHLLHPAHIVVSPVHVGSGTVCCAHGVLQVPAPATALLLRGVPCYGGEIIGELCTPTGAALLSHFADNFGSMPAMAAERIGYGCGCRVFDRPNCLRAFWGEMQEKRAEEISELVCNLDDMTPEALAFACSRLLEQGALDVYTVPGTMKKGRPGWVLTVLCAPEQEQTFAQSILRETTTNGVRLRRCEKCFLVPSSAFVQTKWGSACLKTAHGNGVRHMKPEFDNAAELARDNDLPYYEVMQEIMRKYTGETE